MSTLIYSGQFYNKIQVNGVEVSSGYTLKNNDVITFITGLTVSGPLRYRVTLNDTTFNGSQLSQITVSEQDVCLVGRVTKSTANLTADKLFTQSIKYTETSLYLSKTKINGNVYNFKDTIARNSLLKKQDIINTTNKLPASYLSSETADSGLCLTADGEGNISWTKQTGMNNIYVVPTTCSTVKLFKELVDGHLANNEHYLYDLSSFCSDATCCEVNFVSTAWGGNYLNIFSISKGTYYTDYLGYDYYETGGFTLADYFVKMCEQRTPKVITVTDPSITISSIQQSLTLINALNDIVYFNLSTLTDKTSFLCTIVFDTANSVALITDMLNMQYAEITYDSTTKVMDVIPYVETPIKVFAGTPRSGKYIGELAIAKQWDWQQITQQSDLVVGARYRIQLPANVAVFPTSISGQYIEMSDAVVIQTSLTETTYVYGQNNDTTAHIGYFVTDDTAFLATSLDRTTYTATGYDLTTTTGTTQFIIEADYVSCQHEVSTFFIECTQKQATNYTMPKIWDGVKWTEIASKSDITTIYNELKIVDLSSYSLNDSIPDTLVSPLIELGNDVKYNSAVYQPMQRNTTDTYDAVLYATPQEVAQEAYYYVLVIRKDLTATNPIWVLYQLSTVHLANYGVDGTFQIQLLNDAKKIKLYDDNLTTNILRGEQTGNINLTLPATSGTLALATDLDITSTKIIQALGYTPYSAANPSNYISSYTVTSTDVVDALGYTPYNATNPNNYIAKSDITKSDIITKLGYTPYDASNPQHYLSTYTVTQADITNALGYTPYDSNNPDKYLTSITAKQITTALGYTPYNNTNPSGYLSEITSSDVTTALGYTPYNSTNPNNYITNNTHALTYYYDKDYIDDLVSLGFEAIIVDVKPTDPSTGKIYLVPVEGATDVYEEWMWVAESGTYTWKKLGTTSVDMSVYAKTTDLNSIAFTGAYSALVGAPTIPTQTSQLTNDSGYITRATDNLTYYTKTTDLASVATTGQYSDLLNTPTIPTQTSQLTNNSGYVTAHDLTLTNVSTFINDGDGTNRYATLADIEDLKTLDPEAIQHAIDIATTIGTVSEVIGGTGLTGTVTTTGTINHSNSIAENTVYPTGTVLENGGSFTVRDVNYDATGHITSYQDRVITMTQIPAYDDTEVKEKITSTEEHITTVEQEVDSHFAHLIPSIKFYTFSVLGTEQYIDPTTLQPVTDRYYTRDDIDDSTTRSISNNKIDILLKAWFQYKFGWNTAESLETASVYVIGKDDSGEYINKLVNFWTSVTNTDIANYPNLCQVGSFRDDGYGSVPVITSAVPGVVKSLSQDGYVYAVTQGTAAVYGWGTLKDRVTVVENTIGDINTALDTINGEVI